MDEPRGSLTAEQLADAAAYAAEIAAENPGDEVYAAIARRAYDRAWAAAELEDRQ